MSEPERTIYASSDAKRFFWVPDAEVLPEGTFALRSLTGKRISVDEAAAAAFELPEDRAKEVVQQELERVAKKAGNLLSGAASLLRDAASKPAARPAPKPLTPKAEQNIASSLGVTEDQLRNDPKAVLDALGAVAKGFVTTLKDAVSDDPAQRADAKQRMEVLAGIVKAQTGADTTPMEQMPEKIRDYLQDPALQKTVQDATERLKQATADLQAYTRAEAEKKGD